jgi:ribosomal protein S6--L-glutamate ligase
MVEFSIFDLNKTIKKKIEKTVMIKSSNGLQEQRFIISTMIILNQQTYPILFTLANRETMNYKVLIGTNFLKNRFLIDVSKK